VKLVRILGYVALFLASVIIGLYFTFPYDALKDRLLIEASRRTGWMLEADSMQPSWLTGAVFTEFSAVPPDGGAPIELDTLSVRAHLFSTLTGSPGAHIAFPIGTGAVEADIVRAPETISVDGEVSSVELALVPGLADALGLPLSGKLDLDVDMTVNQKTPAESSGSVTLAAKGLELGQGGKIKGFPIPPLNVGTFEWNIKVENGQLELPKQQLRGGDLEADVEGTVGLVVPLIRSPLNFTLGFRLTDAFLDANSDLAGLLSILNSAKGRDGFYTYRVTGTAKVPRFSPVRS